MFGFLFVLLHVFCYHGFKRANAQYVLASLYKSFHIVWLDVLAFRFMDVAEIIPQMNPGGNGRIMKPELRQLLNKLMFYMDDFEFEKLWNK